MRIITALALAGALAGCSGIGSGSGGSGSAGSGLFGGGRAQGGAPREAPRIDPRTAREKVEEGMAGNRKIWSLFVNDANPSVTVAVNRYLWNASLDVLSFLPVEEADPFSGVIVFGWGRPPGGGRTIRATVQITDPALDARALKVAVITRAGPADPDTVRAVEDAILTRARQLRIRDSKL
ncbi:MAG: DUF3576 domain-containing protein [Alphaproteobacteria bacterium]|nr:MAG: DUF3576 domain-containing protein [Alphaproteobacteria bacterium]